MSGGESLHDELPGGRPRVLEAERGEYEIFDGAIDRQPRDVFDHSAREAESRIVVAPRGAGRRDLHQVRHRLGEGLERLSPAVGAGDLTLPATHVREEMPDGDISTRGVVANL